MRKKFLWKSRRTTRMTTLSLLINLTTATTMKRTPSSQVVTWRLDYHLEHQHLNLSPPLSNANDCLQYATHTMVIWTLISIRDLSLPLRHGSRRGRSLLILHRRSLKDMREISYDGIN